MLTRVCISGLTAGAIEHIDRVLGGKSWRYDINKTVGNMYDVDIADCCDVLYVSNDTATNAIVLNVGDLTAGIKRNEFVQIIAR